MSLRAAAVFSSRSGCRRAIEMPYVYLLVFRTAPEGGETDSATRTCVPQPSASGPTRYHALYCAWQGGAGCGEHAYSPEVLRGAAALLPHRLWDLVEPLLPSPVPKPRGGRPRLSDRACLTGLVFVLRNGILEPFKSSVGPCRAPRTGRPQPLVDSYAGPACSSLS